MAHEHAGGGEKHGSKDSGEYNPITQAQEVFTWDMVFESAALNPDKLAELVEEGAHFGLQVGFGFFLAPFEGGGGGGGGKKGGGGGHH